MDCNKYMLQLVNDILNILYSDFHGNILKDVEYIKKSVRGLVRSFGQCRSYCSHIKLMDDIS